MSRAFIAVLVMAIVTYIPRVIPIAIFKNKLKSRFLKSFLFYTPYAVLGAMIFPSVLYSTNDLIPAAVGFAVALVLAYFDKGLMKVASGAIVAVYISEILI